MKNVIPIILGALMVLFCLVSAQAAHVRISPGDIGIGGYDSNIDGFGLILDDFDLGTLDSSLAGVTLDVITTNFGGSAHLRTNGIGPTWSGVDDTFAVTYSFSAPVEFTWSSSGLDPFGDVLRIFREGEIESFTGSPGTLVATNPVPFAPGLSISPTSIHNLSADDISQAFYYRVFSATSSTWTHDDTIGRFSGKGMFAWITPEPSRALLGFIGFASVLLVRRRH